MHININNIEVGGRHLRLRVPEKFTEILTYWHDNHMPEEYVGSFQIEGAQVYPMQVLWYYPSPVLAYLLDKNEGDRDRTPVLCPFELVDIYIDTKGMGDDVVGQVVPLILRFFDEWAWVNSYLDIRSFDDDYASGKVPLKGANKYHLAYRHELRQYLIAHYEGDQVVVDYELPDLDLSLIQTETKKITA